MRQQLWMSTPGAVSEPIEKCGRNCLQCLHYSVTLVDFAIQHGSSGSVRNTANVGLMRRDVEVVVDVVALIAAQVTVKIVQCNSVYFRQKTLKALF
jgi:hypothetical protein